MSKASKRISAIRDMVAKLGALELPNAVSAVKDFESKLPTNVKKCRFDQSVTLSVRLGIDPRQADQIVRGSIVLPHGIGKSRRIAVFAQGANADAAMHAGADVVGAKDLAERIKSGWMDFDVAIATPDMMGVVGPLGKVLGPRGLMPSPKAGTVTNDIMAVVKEYKAGKVEFRCDSGGNVHCVVGKLSFSSVNLISNIEAMLSYLRSLKPASSKGQYLRGVVVGATMTPSVRVAV